MKRIWNFIRNTMCVIGFVLIYGAASTSDYHVIELGTQEPANIVPMLIIGAVLIFPTLAHLARR